MYALKRFLFFAGFLLFFAFNAFESAPDSKKITETTRTDNDLTLTEREVFFSSHSQARCICETTEEAEERSNDELKYRSPAAVLMVAKQRSPLFVIIAANGGANIMRKNNKRFLLFCNWRL